MAKRSTARAKTRVPASPRAKRAAAKTVRARPAPARFGIAPRLYDSLAELESQYSPRLKHPDSPQTMLVGSRRSDELRRTIPAILDVRYGDGPMQTLDVYQARKGRGPCFVFIHGGFWRMADKNMFTFVAERIAPAGATVFSVNYDLCPNATLDQIVAEIRQAVAWVHKNAAVYGADPNRLYICGHSAGGHLTAMAMAHDWSNVAGFDPACIKGAVPISGVMEPRPLVHLPINQALNLTPEMAARNCPMLLPIRVKAPQLVAVAADETADFIAQSRDYTARLKKEGIAAEFLLVKGAGHFTILDQYRESGSPLLAATLKLMGLNE